MKVVMSEKSCCDSSTCDATPEYFAVIFTSSTKTQGTAGLRSPMRTRKRNKKDGAEEPVSEKEERLSHSDSACRTRQHGVDAVRKRTRVLPTKHHAKMDAGTVKQDYDLTKPGK